MSSLIARIMLAILMFPLASLVYVVCVFVGMEVFWRGRGWTPNRDLLVFLGTGFVTWGFVALYWTLLWVRSVRWTGIRVGLTLASAPGAIAAAALIAVPIAATIDRSSSGFAAFIGSVAAPLIWLVCTILIWRETAAERRERLFSAREAVACPTCGYNLTGLAGTRCPECGATFTLDMILAAHPSRAAGELERP